MSRYDLVVIGCGPAGEHAAIEAGQAGRSVLVVECAPRPGGAMVNTGTLPSKALRETALICSAFRRRPLPRVDLHLDHGLSVPRFMAQRYRLEHEEHDRIEARLDAAGVDITCGHARIAGPHRVAIETSAGIRHVTTDFILVATGSRPVRPDWVPFDDQVIVDADSVLELEHLPRSITIVGAGVIGCEYASIFAEMDTKVTLIHPRHEILPFVDVECRDRLITAMRERNVDVRTGAGVERVSRTQAGTESVLADGSTIASDVLLWAAGRQARTNDIGIESVELECTERGVITIDDQFRTSVSSIFAAGDVMGFPSLASAAMHQGRIAARAMFALPGANRLDNDFPMGIYTIPGISSIGPSHATLVERGVDVVIGRASYTDNPRGRMLGDESGLLKLLFDRVTGTLLAASIVGELATELIAIAQSWLGRPDALAQLAETCFNHPSLAELYGQAARDAIRSCKGLSLAA